VGYFLRSDYWFPLHLKLNYYVPETKGKKKEYLNPQQVSMTIIAHMHFGHGLTFEPSYNFPIIWSLQPLSLPYQSINEVRSVKSYIVQNIWIHKQPLLTTLVSLKLY